MITTDPNSGMYEPGPPLRVADRKAAPSVSPLSPAFSFPTLATPLGYLSLLAYMTMTVLLRACETSPREFT